MDESSQGNSQLDPVLSNQLSKIGTKLGWFSDTSSGKKTKKASGKQKKTVKKVHNDVSDDKENDSSIAICNKTKASRKKGKKVLKENSQHSARKKLISAIEFSSDSDDLSLTKPKILAQDSSEDENTALRQYKVPESQCMVIPNTQCSQVAQLVARNLDQAPEILVSETQEIIPKEQGYLADVSAVPESCINESLTGSRKQEMSNPQEVVEESIVLNTLQNKALLRPIVSSTKKKKKHKDKNCDSSMKSNSKKKFYNMVDFSSEENSDASKQSDVKKSTTERSNNTDKPKVTKGKKLSKRGVKAKKQNKPHFGVKFSSDEESDNSVDKKSVESISSVAQQRQNTTNSKADMSVENLSQRLELLLSATRSRKKKYEETLNLPKKSKRNLKFDACEDKEATGSTHINKEVVEIQENVNAANGKEKTKVTVSKPCSCNLDHSESHDHSMDGTPLNKGQNCNSAGEGLSHISEEISKTQNDIGVHHEKCESMKGKNDSTPDLIFMLTNNTKSSENSKEMYDTTGLGSEESNLKHRYARQNYNSDMSQSLFDSSKGSSTVSKTVSLFASECCPDKNSEREGVSSLEVNDDKNCTGDSTFEHYPFTSDPTVVEILKETQTAEESLVEMKNISLQVSLEDSDMLESFEISLNEENAEKSITKMDMSLQCSMTSNDEIEDLSHQTETESCGDYEETDIQSSCQVSQNDLIPSMKSLSLQVSMQDDSVHSSSSHIQENNSSYTIQIHQKETSTSLFCGETEEEYLDSTTQSENADQSGESNIALQMTSCDRTQNVSEATQNASSAQSMLEMKTVSLQVSLATSPDEASGMLDDSENNDDFSQDFQLSQAISYFTNDEAAEGTTSTQEFEEKGPPQSSLFDIREGSVHDSQYFTSDASNNSSKHSVGNFSLQVSLISQPDTSQQCSLFTNDESQSIVESQTNILSTQSFGSSEISDQTVNTQESLFTSDTSITDQAEDQSEIVTDISSPTSLDVVSVYKEISNSEIPQSSRPKRNPSGVSNASTNISFTTACNDSDLLTNEDQDISEGNQRTLDDSTKSVELKSRSLKSDRNDSSIVTGFKNLSLQSSMISSDGSFTRNDSYNNLHVHHIDNSGCDRKSVAEDKETDQKDIAGNLLDKSNDTKYDTEEESSSDHRQEIKETSEVEDDFYLPDIDEPQVSNKKQRRKSRSQREKSLHGTPRAMISDSSDEEEGLENFFQKMKTPAVSRQVISSDEEDNSMKEFVVSDCETSGLEDNSDSDSSVFYMKTNKIMDERSTAKKPSRYITLLSSSGDSDDDFQFKTPAVKTKRNIPEKLYKTVTKGHVSSINRSPSTEKTPKSFRPHIRPNTTGHTPLHFSFLRSLSSDMTNDKQNLEAKRYKKDFKKTKEELTAKLFQLYNSTIFGNELPQDMSVTWNSRLYKTAGFCAYKRNVMAQNGRSARIELSVKVCDTAERVRDTLVHELCHAAVWLMYGKNDGHGPYWKQWARKANQVHPDLPPIKRCHTYEIDHKYIYKCTKCGYQIGRHSKSLDTARKVCGYCQSPFELLVRSKGSAGQKTPQTPRTPNSFALFVKANYGSVKKEQKGRKHQEVMKMLSAQFQAQKICS